MTLDSVLAISDHANGRRIGDELVVLDLRDGNYLSLNGVAARIWELISEGRSLAQVCAAMEDEYDVERDVLERDIIGLATDLQARGLVRRQS